MTLVELTVVILVVLSLISVLMIGAAAWKSGADKAGCILNISTVQKAGRSQQNLLGASPGDSFDPGMIIGPGSFMSALPVCKSEGEYSFAPTIPEPGALFMTCSVDSHQPANTLEW
jgi:hypothetical protein